MLTAGTVYQFSQQNEKKNQSYTKASWFWLNIFKLLCITQLHQLVRVHNNLIYFCIRLLLWHYWSQGFLRCHFTSGKLVPDHRVRLLQSRTNHKMFWKLNQITNVHMAKQGRCFTCMRACAWNWSLTFGRQCEKEKQNFLKAFIQKKLLMSCKFKWIWMWHNCLCTSYFVR